MARKKEIKIDEVLVAENIEVKEEIKEEVKKEKEGSIKIVLEENKKADKNVRVLLNCNHKCFIGGEWYYFEKGKCYNVPTNVKNILLRAGKLSPL